MKIIDHRTFLTYPPGTLFARCDGGFRIPGFKSNSIERENVLDEIEEDLYVDFFYREFIPPMNLDTNNQERVMAAAAAHPEGRLPDFEELDGRDGEYDYDAKYLIWEEDDLLQLVARIEEHISGEEDNCTPAQRKRWLNLQRDLPGVEIERCPGGIGYWSRNAGYPCPREDGEEREGWLQADGDIKDDGEQPVEMLKRLIGQIRSPITLQAVFTEVESKMLGLRASYHEGDQVLVVSKIYTGPGTVVSDYKQVATDEITVRVPDIAIADEISKRTGGVRVWVFKVGEIARRPETWVRPTTRGELRDRLAKGETCEVAAMVAEMTTVMLQGWLKAVPFEVVPSPEAGWVLFRPTPPPEEPRGSEHPIDGDVGLG